MSDRRGDFVNQMPVYTESLASLRILEVVWLSYQHKEGCFHFHYPQRYGVARAYRTESAADVQLSSS